MPSLQGLASPLSRKGILAATVAAPGPRLLLHAAAVAGSVCCWGGWGGVGLGSVQKNSVFCVCSQTAQAHET
jgi:hypothetical protein